jgi:hypothetical protein
LPYELTRPNVLIAVALSFSRAPLIFTQRWSNLQELTVYLYGLGLPEGLRSAAKAFTRVQFPVLESRGILCVFAFDTEKSNPFSTVLFL